MVAERIVLKAARVTRLGPDGAPPPGELGTSFAGPVVIEAWDEKEPWRYLIVGSRNPFNDLCSMADWLRAAGWTVTPPAYAVATGEGCAH